MQRRRRVKQTQSLEERLAAYTHGLREEAKRFPPGADRNDRLRRAQQAEYGQHLSEWLRSAGVKPAQLDREA